MPAWKRLPRMQPMHTQPMTTRSRRTIFGALALWLCVLVAGVVAPWAHSHQLAGSMERLCSGHEGPVQWVPSPASNDAQGDAAALHHVMDCPLCLPVLASAGAVHFAVLLELAQHHGAISWHTPVRAWAGYWPPARGPPLSI